MADIDVTERSFPFSSGQGAAVTEDDWSAMAGTFQDNGVNDGPDGTALLVVQGPTPNTIQITPGTANIDGFYYRLTAPKIMTVLPNPDTINRTDLVSLHLDLDAKEILPVVTSSTTYAGLAEGDVPLSEWSQLPTTTATPTLWGSATDKRWFGGARMRSSLAGAQPPPELGAFLHVPAVGGSGNVYIGAKDTFGVTQWVPWSPGQFWLSAKDYGTVGNGTTDDTAALQAALNAAGTAGGGVVVIPPGTYKVTNFLAVKANTTIYAYGATLKSAGNTGLLRNFLGTDTFTTYGGNSRIRVFGGIWDGNAGTGSGGTTTAETDVINFVHCRDIIVRDVTVRNVSSAHGLEFNSVDGARAINCRFEGYRDNSGTSARQFSEAIQIDIAVSGSASIGSFDNTPCKNVLIQGCYMGPAVDGSGNGVFGKLVGSHTAASGVFYENIQILDNIVNGALDIGIRAYAWRKALIANNTVRGTVSHGISVEQRSDDAVDSINVENNVIEDAGGSSIAVIGTTVSNIYNIVVSGNTSIDATATAISLTSTFIPVVSNNVVYGGNSTGILLTLGDAGTVNGNSIYGTGSNCINLFTHSNVTVTGNRARSPAANYIVNVQASHNNLFSGNQFSDPGANLAIFNFTVAAQFNTVTGNVLRRGSNNAFVVRSNNSQTSPDASAYVNNVYHNDCRGFLNSADVVGSAGTAGGFAWITTRTGPINNGVITKTTPTSTNAGANFTAGTPL